MTVEHVVSKDGTPIAFELSGVGPPVLLVCGGLDDGSENAPLAAALAERFSVINYARRGRGRSGDTLPYALEREFEDLAAVLRIADGPAFVYGTSSGGALALEAAAAGVPGIAKIAVYEIPYNMAPDWPEQWRTYVNALTTALAGGKRGAALELFLRITGASDDDIAAARSSPFWSDAERLEHTLAYDAACLGTGQPDPRRLASVKQPTLVLCGDAADRPAAPWIAALTDAAAAITSAIPGATQTVLKGQAHVPAPATLADTLAAFFAN